MNIKKYKNFCIAIFGWLTIRLKIERKLTLPLERLLEKFFIVFSTRGTQSAIQFNKELRSELFRVLSRYNQEDLSRTDIELPKRLKFLKDIGKDKLVPFLKLLITVLYVSRALRTKAIPSFQSITSPSTMREYPFCKEDFVKFWTQLGYSEKLKPNKLLDFQHYHVSGKAGPNGPAVWTSISDLLSLDTNLVKHICILGGRKLTEYIHLLTKYLPMLKEYFSAIPGISRKLIYFSDREGKTREVAIFDYYSQTSLIPLHKYLFKVLKKIPQDFTFDQTGFESSLSTSKVFYSIDLTAFTDRFPIRVNKDLLEPRIGPERAEAWFQIMTQEFSSDIGRIRYSVGNPMGAYSSWNSTTLAHHFVVWKACKNKGLNWKTLPYAMLGDDLVIGNRQVALEYCRLIRTLGVHWSKEKTHISAHFFEFAKRLHWCGHDISPFPTAGLWSERNRLSGQVQVMDNAVSKGWFSASECQESLDEYFSFRGLPRRLRTKWKDSMIKVWKIVSILQKKSSALELLPFVEKISAVVASKLDETKIQNILVNSIMLSFVDSSSNLLDNKKHKDSLGGYAETITMFLTSFMFEPGFEDSISLPESLPHTHVWGVISEQYLMCQREAYIIDTIRGGDWDPLLRNLRIPLSDRSLYFGRKMDLLTMHSSSIVDKFEESIHQLKMYPQLI